MNENLKKADECHKLSTEYIDKAKKAQKNNEGAAMLRFYVDTAEDHRAEGEKYMKLAEKELLDKSIKYRKKMFPFMVCCYVFYISVFAYEIITGEYWKIFPYITSLIWMTLYFYTIRKTLKT